MIIVVNDANILIDLIKLKLVECFFKLNWEFHTTSLIIEHELYDEQKEILMPYIQHGTLISQELSTDDIFAIITIQKEKPQLSDKDCSALLYAQKLNACILTSDYALRKFAKHKNLDVHGHLYIFDALVEQQCLSPKQAIQKLADLNIINSKLQLPKTACENRIAKWKLL